MKQKVSLFFFEVVRFLHFGALENPIILARSTDYRSNYFFRHSKLRKLATRRERPKSAPYLRLKNIQGTTIGKIWKKIFFQKKIFDFFFEKNYFLGRTMPKNSKRGHSGSFNVFYKPKTGR